MGGKLIFGLLTLHEATCDRYSAPLFVLLIERKRLDLLVSIALGFCKAGKVTQFFGFNIDVSNKQNRVYTAIFCDVGAYIWFALVFERFGCG